MTDGTTKTKGKAKARMLVTAAALAKELGPADAVEVLAFALVSVAANHQVSASTAEVLHALAYDVEEAGEAHTPVGRA